MSVLPADIIILNGMYTGGTLIMTAAIAAFVIILIRRRNRKS